VSEASNAGEVTGIIAASAAALFSVGRGFQWLLSWNEGRAERRAVKLQAWHDELTARESAFDKRVEDRLKMLEQKAALREAENMALRMAFEVVSSALRTIDPRNTALSRAEQHLQVAFPLAPIVPPDMTLALQTIEVEVN